MDRREFFGIAAATSVAAAGPPIYAQTRTLRSPVTSPRSDGLVLNAAVMSNVRDFGAVGNGEANDLPAFTASISALPGDGGALAVPPGQYAFSGSLAQFHAALNSKRSVTIVGPNGPTYNGNGAPPFAAPCVIHCSALADYLFRRSGRTLESLTVEGIAFDGASGTTDRSTTWPGVASTSDAETFLWTFRRVVAGNTRYAHATGTSASGGNKALFDLNRSVTTLLEDCFLFGVPNGRLIYAGNGGTTTRIVRGYLSQCREAAFFRDAHAVGIEDTVFESMTVALCSHLSNVILERPYFENIGHSPFGATHTAGLTPRGFGAAYSAAAFSGEVNCAINQMHGNLILRDVQMMSLATSRGATILAAWVEALGALASRPGAGGGWFAIDGGRRFDQNGTDPLFQRATMAFGSAARSSYFDVSVREAWGTSPTGQIMMDARDMRLVNEGVARVRHTGGGNHLARIRRGRFVYELQEPATSFTGTPVSSPLGTGSAVDYEVGDTIIYPTPVAGGFVGKLCTAAGQPGTWKDFGAIQS